MSVAAEIESEKRVVASAAAELVERGTTVGLGSGSTVAYLLPALATRRLAVGYVTSSPAKRQTSLIRNTDRLNVRICCASWRMRFARAASAHLRDHPHPEDSR